MPVRPRSAVAVADAASVAVAAAVTVDAIAFALSAAEIRVFSGRISVSARARTRSSWLARITRWVAAASAIILMTMSALSASRWAVGSSRTSTSAPSPRRCCHARVPVDAAGRG